MEAGSEPYLSRWLNRKQPFVQVDECQALQGLVIHVQTIVCLDGIWEALFSPQLREGYVTAAKLSAPNHET